MENSSLEFYMSNEKFAPKDLTQIDVAYDEITPLPPVYYQDTNTPVLNPPALEVINNDSEVVTEQPATTEEQQTFVLPTENKSATGVNPALLIGSAVLLYLLFSKK